MRRTLILALVALALVGANLPGAAPPVAAQTGPGGPLITLYTPGFVNNAISGRVENVPGSVMRLTVVVNLHDGSHRNADVGPFNGWSFVIQGIFLSQVRSATLAGMPSGTPAPSTTYSPGWLAPWVWGCGPFGYGYGYGAPFFGYGSPWYDWGAGYYGYGNYYGYGWGYGYGPHYGGYGQSTGYGSQP